MEACVVHTVGEGEVRVEVADALVEGTSSVPVVVRCSPIGWSEE